MAFREIQGCFQDEPPISDADKRVINVLGEPEASMRWDHLVSNRHRHLMLLDQTEWPARLVHDAPVFYNWLDDWRDDVVDSFRDILRTLDIELAETVTVFWMREQAVESTWDAFTRNWINFLYEHEGCIVVPSVSIAAVVLSNGNSWVGSRSSAA